MTHVKIEAIEAEILMLFGEWKALTIKGEILLIMDVTDIGCC